jgi:1-acyl-sn-glycerol-3-phosphate acyltransferase
VRLIVLMTASGLLITFTSIALLPVAAITLGRARRLYAGCATGTARAIFRMWGIRLVVHRDGPWPARQVVYVSNHSSTLDLFALVAIGLPNTRFFLSGFLRKYVPLGIIATLMGTFFTVLQDRPDERRRIFQRALRVLQRTGESVYLSPEGERVTTGQIGHFNKGAFHLATNLRAPIVPLYFSIPSSIDPKRGYDARPGAMHVYVKPPIETTDWRVEDLIENKERVRQLFVGWHAEARS